MVSFFIYLERKRVHKGIYIRKERGERRERKVATQNYKTRKKN
jgi:hypothetical protein